MAFDPDAYLAKKTTSGSFNPDAYLAKKTTIPQPKQSAYQNTAEDLSFMHQLAAGAGGAIKGMELGARQMLPFTTTPTEQELQEYKDAMEGLRGTGGGLTGEILGTVATAIHAGAGAFRAATALPMLGGRVAQMTASTGGRAALAASGGGTQAALIPTDSQSERVLNVAGGAALGAGTSKLMDSIVGRIAQKRAAGMNTQTEEKILKEIQDKTQVQINAPVDTATQQVIKVEGMKIPAQEASEISRLQTLKTLPVPITTQDVISSQITRKYPQQEAERLVAGQPFIGTELMARLERGQSKMGQNIDALQAKTGAQAPTKDQAGEVVRNWLQNVYGAAKKDTNNMYEYARQLHGDKVVIPSDELVDQLVSQRAMPGYRDLYTQAKNMGLLVEDELGNIIPQPITINVLDKYKSSAQSLTNSNDGNLKYAGGDIINKVYNQLDKSAPEFIEAAKLRKRQGEFFENPTVTQKILGTKAGRFGADEKTVGGITIPDYKVASEKLIDTVTNGSIEDLRYIRKLALTGTKEQKTQGVAAIREMRGSVIEGLRETWYKTQTPLSKANQINKYFDKLGEQKIEILFGKMGAKQIKQFRDAAEIMNKSVPSPEGGSQTASRLMNMGNQMITLLEKTPIAVLVVPIAKTTKAAFTAGKAKNVQSAKSRLSDLAREKITADLMNNKQLQNLRGLVTYGAQPSLRGSQDR